LGCLEVVHVLKPRREKLRISDEIGIEDTNGKLILFKVVSVI